MIFFCLLHESAEILAIHSLTIFQCLMNKICLEGKIIPPFFYHGITTVL